MAKSQGKALNPAQPDLVMADGETLNLHNRTLAAVLAWLIPGAGHLYQQRYFKSAVFFLCIMSSFGIGMFVASGRCVYASWNVAERRWQYVLQAGVGLPAMPAAYYAWSSPSNPPRRNVEVKPFMAPPTVEVLDKWHHDTASGFDMGTLYTMVAGLLNILAVFDAYGGPLPPPVGNKRKDPADGDASDESVGGGGSENKAGNKS